MTTFHFCKISILDVSALYFPMLEVGISDGLSKNIDLMKSQGCDTIQFKIFLIRSKDDVIVVISLPY